MFVSTAASRPARNWAVLPLLLLAGCALWLAACSGGPPAADSDRDGSAAAMETPEPEWAVRLHEPWPLWARAVRAEPTVIRLGFTPLRVGDTLEEISGRYSRLDTDDPSDPRSGSHTSYVRRDRRLAVTVAALAEHGAVEEVHVRFADDAATVISGSQSVQEPSPVAGKAYACRTAGSRIEVQRLDEHGRPDPHQTVETVEQAMVWQAVRPVVHGQLLARALSSRSLQVGKPLSLNWEQVAVLIGADRRWHTESAEATLLGSARVDGLLCAVLEVAVRALVAGDGATIQTVELTGKVAVEQATGRSVAVALELSTMIESASLDDRAQQAYPDTYGQHRVLIQHHYRLATE